MKKKFVVIGCSDSKFGDFVINHWSKSLLKCIDRRKVDILLLNYGLTKIQKSKLLSKKIKVIDCVRDGHIVNLRYRDTLRFLNKNDYQQVMACDSGDVVFQRNIMDIFYKNQDNFRAVAESVQPPTLEYSLAKKTFPENIKKNILKLLKGRKMINGGLIVAPNKKFKDLCRQMLKLIKRKDSFGPDQIILNYVLYKDGFIDLGSDFNYIPVTAAERFRIKRGVFYNKNGEVISIVHNAGNYSFFRTIKDFGYGKEYNKKFSFLSYLLLRSSYRIVSAYRWIKNRLY